MARTVATPDHGPALSSLQERGGPSLSSSTNACGQGFRWTDIRYIILIIVHADWRDGHSAGIAGSHFAVRWGPGLFVNAVIKMPCRWWIQCLVRRYVENPTNTQLNVPRKSLDDPAHPQGHQLKRKKKLFLWSYVGIFILKVWTRSEILIKQLL